jgi:hypothetical protein
MCRDFLRSYEYTLCLGRRAGSISLPWIKTQDLKLTLDVVLHPSLLLLISVGLLLQLRCLISNRPWVVEGFGLFL